MSYGINVIQVLFNSLTLPVDPFNQNKHSSTGRVKEIEQYSFIQVSYQ